MIGETLGSYRIVEKIGAGGMGVVYLAEHPLLGKKAAVKLLLPEYSQNKEMVNRFFNEARATTLIKHPGLVDVFDFGHYKDGSAYIVMEYLEGSSLSDVLERERTLDLSRLVPVARQIASAVGAAHKKGIVHRDLKPDNIFLIDDADVPSGRRAKVLDFGIAKLMGQGASSQTRSGSMMGTPLYMAPEQCRGAGTIDHRADVYALGCILYEMVAGEPPFTGDGPGDVIASHLRSTPTPIAEHAPEMEPALGELIMAMLAKDPARRPQSMPEIATNLDQIWERYKQARSNPTRDRDLETPLPVLSTAWIQPKPKPASGEALAPTLAEDSSVTLAKAPSMPGAGADQATVATPAPAAASGQPDDGEAATAAGEVAATAAPAPAAALPSQPEPLTRSKPPSATTLGGAAGETIPPMHRRPVWLWPATAGSTVVLAVSLYLAFGRGSHRPSASPVAATSLPARPATPAPAPVPATPAATPAPTPVPPAAPATVALVIDSTPSGADVYRFVDGMRMGKTPLTQHVTRSEGTASFVLKLDGYEDARVELPGDRDGKAAPSLLKRASAHHAGKPAHHAETPSKPAQPPAKPDKPAKPDRPEHPKGGDGNDPVDPFSH